MRIGIPPRSKNLLADLNVKKPMTIIPAVTDIIVPFNPMVGKRKCVVNNDAKRALNVFAAK